MARRVKSLESGSVHCWSTSLFALVFCLPLSILVGVTIAPLGREEGSLSGLC